MIELSLQNPAFAPMVRTALIGQPDAVLLVEFSGADKAALVRKLDQLVELMGDLGLPGSVVRDDRRRAAEEPVGSAQGRPEHHDEPQGRRQAGELHRGLRRAAGAPGRIHRRADAGVPQARQQGHLVRARLGRHAARAAHPGHAARGRAQDARDRRGSLGAGAQVQGRLQRRARRRPVPRRVDRVAVRPADQRGLRARSSSCSTRSTC